MDSACVGDEAGNGSSLLTSVGGKVEEPVMTQSLVGGWLCGHENAENLSLRWEGELNPLAGQLLNAIRYTFEVHAMPPHATTISHE